jgi:hypothetical protein
MDDLRPKIAAALLFIYVPVVALYSFVHDLPTVHAEDNPPVICSQTCRADLPLQSALHYCLPVQSRVEKLLDQVIRIDLTFCTGNRMFHRTYDISMQFWDEANHFKVKPLE